MYGILVLCLGYLSYVWDISLMYGILVLCLDIRLMYGVSVLCFGKKQNRMSLGCNYGGVYCLMFGILVLCMRY